MIYSNFRGDCKAEYRYNTFSVLVESIKTDKNGVWKKQQNAKDDYYYKHTEDHPESILFDDQKTKEQKSLIAQFGNGNYYINATIDSGCTPLLKIQFFHHLADYNLKKLENEATSGDEIEQPMGKPLALSITGNSDGAEILDFSKLRILKQNSDESDNFEPENQMSFSTKFGLGIAVATGGFVCVILIVIGLIKIKKRRLKPEIIEV